MGWGWGDGHGAQGYGFHSTFHLGPAIVFPSKSPAKGLSDGATPRRVQNGRRGIQWVS